MTDGIPLTQWLTNNSQTKLSKLTGFTQTAISKMVKVGRNVYVVVEDGETRLKENKALAPKNSP